MSNTAKLQPAKSFVAPPGTAEELAAALEASTGERRAVDPKDPLNGEQVKRLLDDLLLAARPDRGLDVLARQGVLAAILPEVSALVGFGEGIRHKDVWTHTQKVICRTPPRLDLRWAALLHDIGKVRTRRFEPDGQVTFLGHPEVGARMFEKITRRLPFDENSTDRIRFLVAAHLRAAAYSDDWTDSAVRRFGRDAGDRLDDLLDLSRADITSKHMDKVRRGLRQIDLLELRVAHIKMLDEKPAPLPKGLGLAICEHCGISPGPGLGQIMKRLTGEVEAEQLLAQQPFEYYLAALDDHPSWLPEGQKGRPDEQR